MPGHPDTPLTVQITRHWHGVFSANAAAARQRPDVDVFQRKLEADSAQSMADDLLEQLQRAHAVFGNNHAMFNADVLCPVKECSVYRHPAIAGECEPAPDALDAAIAVYVRAKDQPPEYRAGALMVARQAVLRAAEFELKKPGPGTPQ